MWTTKKTVDRAERTTSAYVSSVTAGAVTLVLVSLAAAAFELHSILGWVELGLLSPLKSERTGNWGPERGNELPKVTPQKAWMVLISVWIPEGCSLHTNITSQQSRRLGTLNALNWKPQDVAPGYAEVTNTPQSWWVSLSALACTFLLF